MVTRKVKHKNADGTVIEADIGVLAENVQEDTGRQFVSGAEKEKLNNLRNTTVDAALDADSVNPVQNKVVKNALDGKVPVSRKVNGKALNADVVLSASDVGAVSNDELTSQIRGYLPLSAGAKNPITGSLILKKAASSDANANYSEIGLFNNGATDHDVFQITNRKDYDNHASITLSCGQNGQPGILSLGSLTNGVDYNLLLTGVSDPSADNDAANKKYVDGCVDTLKKSVSDGKALVAAAITAKKIAAAASDTFAVLADKIGQIVLGSGNAQTGDVVKGKTFTNDDGVEYTGTLEEYSGITKSATASLDTTNSRLQMAIPAVGKYNTASKLYATYAAIRSVIGLTADKLWYNTTILGLKSTRTGQAAKTWTPGTSNQTIPAGTCCTGAQTIKGDPNLVPANIKKGVSIFGKTGTWEGYTEGSPAFFRNGSYGALADLGAYLTRGNAYSVLDTQQKVSISNGSMSFTFGSGQERNYLFFRRSFSIKRFAGKKIRVKGSVVGTYSGLWIGLFRKYDSGSYLLSVKAITAGPDSGDSFTYEAALPTSESYEYVTVGMYYTKSTGFCNVTISEICLV